MASVSSDVSRPRTISTSGSTGTGLKKWSPRKRSGRPEARPRVEIEIDEVFEAKIVGGGAIVASSWKSEDFGSRLLNNRLDDEIGACRVGDRAGTQVRLETSGVLVPSIVRSRPDAPNATRSPRDPARDWQYRRPSMLSGCSPAR